MFDRLNLDGMEVADLAAGSGYNSAWVARHFPGAKLTGFDISQKACAAYRSVVGRPAHMLDLTSGRDSGLRFDVVMIFGGLHHCVLDLPATLTTIAYLVRPGGLLLMYEPNSRYLLEGVRKLWLLYDKKFQGETEAALDHDALCALGKPHFEPIDCVYMGGPAYFLIYNSMILRVPRGFKKYLAPILFPLEAGYNHLPGTRAFPYFIARWRRSSDVW
jgi:SAM-dependent methyltransferase